MGASTPVGSIDIAVRAMLACLPAVLWLPTAHAGLSLHDALDRDHHLSRAERWSDLIPAAAVQGLTIAAGGPRPGTAQTVASEAPAEGSVGASFALIDSAAWQIRAGIALARWLVAAMELRRQCDHLVFGRSRQPQRVLRLGRAAPLGAGLGRQPGARRRCAADTRSGMAARRGAKRKPMARLAGPMGRRSVHRQPARAHATPPALADRHAARTAAHRSPADRLVAHHAMGRARP